MNLPVVPDGEGRPLDQVRVSGLRAFGRHGVFEHERRDGQEFVVDAVLHLDSRAAASSDDLADTVDYGTLALRLADIVGGEPVDLIETLAARLAGAALADPRVAAVDVTVHKPQAPVPVPFADIAVTVRRTRSDLLDLVPAAPVTAVLALGTNLGDRAATLRAGVAGLSVAPGLTVTAVSPVVESDPVGGPAQPDYLNAVVLVTTTLSPRALLAACHAVEAAHGRTRDVRWGPRTLDVDVITYGGLVARAADLDIPHPRAGQRAFVLAPWLGADPQARLLSPDGVAEPVADLLGRAPGIAGVHPRDDVRLDVPS